MWYVVFGGEFFGVGFDMIGDGYQLDFVDVSDSVGVFVVDGVFVDDGNVYSGRFLYCLVVVVMVVLEVVRWFSFDF